MGNQGKRNTKLWQLDNKKVNTMGAKNWWHGPWGRTISALGNVFFSWEKIDLKSITVFSETWQCKDLTFHPQIIYTIARRKGNRNRYCCAKFLWYISLPRNCACSESYHFYWGVGRKEHTHKPIPLKSQSEKNLWMCFLNVHHFCHKRGYKHIRAPALSQNSFACGTCQRHTSVFAHSCLWMSLESNRSQSEMPAYRLATNSENGWVDPSASLTALSCISIDPLLPDVRERCPRIAPGTT